MSEKRDEKLATNEAKWDSELKIARVTWSEICARRRSNEVARNENFRRIFASQTGAGVGGEKCGREGMLWGRNSRIYVYPLYELIS